ncbi:MAG: hypothetical protein AAF570_28640, partial [Bacteroidota bacterium]
MKALKTYISAFHSKGENKPLELLRLIEKNADLSAEDAAKRLYGNPKSKAFIMMKARLFEKMTEFLPLSVNPATQKYSKEMPYFRDLIEFRKSMLIATILQEKRLGQLALDYFDRALRLARKCNTPELEVDVLVRLRAINRMRVKEFEALSAELRKCLARQEIDINTMGIYHKFYELHTLKTQGDDEKIEFLEKHLPDLVHSLRQHYSPRADYYVQMLLVNLYSLQADYEACKKAVDTAITVIKENKGLRTRQRMSDPWFQWGMMEMKFHKYHKAIEAFDQTLSVLKSNSRAYLVTSIMMLYAFIYLDDLDRASEKAKEITQIAGRLSKIANPSIYGLYTYLQA